MEGCGRREFRPLGPRQCRVQRIKLGPRVRARLDLEPHDLETTQVMSNHCDQYSMKDRNAHACISGNSKVGRGPQLGI